MAVTKVAVKDSNGVLTVAEIGARWRKCLPAELSIVVTGNVDRNARAAVDPETGLQRSVVTSDGKSRLVFEAPVAQGEVTGGGVTVDVTSGDEGDIVYLPEALGDPGGELSYNWMVDWELNGNFHSWDYSGYSSDPAASAFPNLTRTISGELAGGRDMCLFEVRRKDGMTYYYALELYLAQEDNRRLGVWADGAVTDGGDAPENGTQYALVVTCGDGTAHRGVEANGLIEVKIPAGTDPVVIEARTAYPYAQVAIENDETWETHTDVDGVKTRYPSAAAWGTGRQTLEQVFPILPYQLHIAVRSEADSLSVGGYEYKRYVLQLTRAAQGT